MGYSFAARQSRAPIGITALLLLTQAGCAPTTGSVPAAVSAARASAERSLRGAIIASLAYVGARARGKRGVGGGGWRVL